MSEITRVTTLETSRTMLDYIMGSEAKYNELAQQASSGIRVNEISDDPVAVKQILSLNTQINQLSGYKTNMSTAQGELDVVDSTLASLTSLVEDASGYATQGANGTYNKDDLAAIKSQVDSILDNTVDLANTDYGGKYVFSGTATSTQTYSVTYDSSGKISNVTYNGTSSADYKRYVTISEGVSVPMNARGNDVFGSYTSTSSTSSSPTGTVGTTVTFGTDGSGNKTITTATTVYNSGTSEYDTTTTVGTATGFIGDLVVLSNALEQGNTDVVNSCIDSLDTDLDTITATRTKLAAVSNKFDITSDTIDETITNLKSYRSDLQDADLTEVLTDLATSKNALEATYSVTSEMLSSTTLLDYL